MLLRRKNRLAGACMSALIGCVSLVGCLVNEGIDPPRGVLNFPVQLEALTLEGDVAPRILYVANSNFDLLYNAATLQAYDLEVANRMIDEGCAEAISGRCAVIPKDSVYLDFDAANLTLVEADEPLLLSEVFISSYTQDMKLSPRGDTLYLSVQGDGDITHVRLGERGELQCGSVEPCDAHFRSTDRTTLADDLSFPMGPMGLYVGTLDELGLEEGSGNYILVADRDGSISLLIDRLREGEQPFVTDILPELGPESSPTLARDPHTGVVWAPALNGSYIGRVIPAIDSATDPAQLLEARLDRLAGFNVWDLNVGGSADIRQVIFDPRPGRHQVYLLARSPSALIIADRRGDFGSRTGPGLIPTGIIDLGTGPSRMAVERFEVDGEELLLGFVTSFDSRDLYVVDLDRGELLSVAAGLSGPFEFLIDKARRRIYLVDYHTSVIRFIDLEPMFGCLEGNLAIDDECTPTVLGTIGVPNALEGLR